MLRKTASFTGHRPKEIFGEYNMKNKRALLLSKKLTIEIERLINEEKVDTFISGGALGVDQIAFICVHQLKKKYPHIKNILAIPYLDQAVAWEEQLKKFKYSNFMKGIEELTDTLKIYYHILRVADEIVYVDEIEKYQPKSMNPKDIGRHSNSKLQLRNMYMVDHSQIVVSVFNGKPGGTKNCVDYAKKKNKPIINLDPDYDFEPIAI